MTRRHLFIVFLQVLLVVLILWRCWPATMLTRQRATLIVRQTSCYKIKQGDTTLLSFAPDTLYSPGVWANRFWFISSCHGRAVTCLRANDSLFAAGCDTLATLQRYISQVDSLKNGLQRELNELDYFLKVHGVKDEGYAAITEHRKRVSKDLQKIQQTSYTLNQIDSTDNIHIEREDRFSFFFLDRKGQLIKQTAYLVQQHKGNRFVTLQNRTKRRPLTLTAITLYPWTPNIPDYIYLAKYGEMGRLAIGDACNAKITKRLAVQNTQKAEAKYMQGTLIDGNYVYKGGISRGNYAGYGVLWQNDSIIYAGQWVEGKRVGRGWIKDKLGRQIRGTWSADTLNSGVRIDSQGNRYFGQLTKDGIAEGHGMMIMHDKSMYEGNWQNDERNGFGFAIALDGALQLGDWAQNRYKGEILVHSTERIYGIDISKYQHEIGNKRYTIDWNRLRITNLGTISKKRVDGTVDYPISFVYIKSTEGTTVKNAYFHTDYANARAHGFSVGAYHFFSTTSSASQQARYFLENTTFKRGDFPPVLDVEPSTAQINAIGEDVMWSNIRQWLKQVEKAVGVTPILYISQSFANKYLPQAPDIQSHYPIWLARYGEYKPNGHLVFWQLCPDGGVEGIAGEVDINVFNGYQNQYQFWLRNSLVR